MNIPKNMILVTLLLSTISLVTLISFSTVTEAAEIGPTFQTFFATDFNYTAPVSLMSYKGETVVGLNSTLGCGYADPDGDYASDDAYFEINMTTPEEYLWRVSFRAFARDVLSNDLWLFFTSNKKRGQAPEKNLLSLTPSNAGGDFFVRDLMCLYIPADRVVPNTIRLKPHEPGSLVQYMRLDMIKQPAILSAKSFCGGPCDLDKPIPIRVVFDQEICVSATATHDFGSIIVTGSTGAVHSCSTVGQLKDFDGNWFIDCLIPTNVTQGSANIKAAIKWPTSVFMPANAEPSQLAVIEEELNLAWIAAPACVVALVLGYLLYVLWKRWKATKDAPRDANNLATMFVAARGVASLWEKAPKTTADALVVYDKIIRSAARSNSCYIARKIGESYLVVAKDPVDLFKASAQIQKECDGTNWSKILTGYDVPPELKKMTTSKRRRGPRRTGSGISGDDAGVSGGAYDLVAAAGDSHGDSEGNLSGPDSRGSVSSQNNNNNHEGSGGNVNNNSINLGNPSGTSHRSSSGENKKRVGSTPQSPALSPAEGRLRSSGFGSGSKSEVSRRSSSSHHSSENKHALVRGVSCSISIVIGKARIQVHEAGTVSEYETYDYTGEAVDEAATIVDLAHSGQTLCTGVVHDAIKENEDECNGSCTLVAEKTVRGKMMNLYQFNPAGLTDLTCGLQEEENVDSIQAQLDAAANGFAQKVCTILYLELHGLIDQATNEDDRQVFLDKYSSLYKPIQEIIKHSGGTLINITASNLVVAWNAFTPSAMHVTRSATCIFRLRELFNSTSILKKFDLCKISFCGGLATGPAVVGTLESDKSHKQIFGAGWNSAQELMRLARPFAANGSLNCPVLAIWNSRSDLNNCAQLQFIDVVATKAKARTGVTASIGPYKQNATANNNRSDGESPNRRQQAFALKGLVAVMGEAVGSDDADDAEWMYDLENKNNNNPYHAANEAFAWLLGDFVADAEERWHNVLKKKCESQLNDLAAAEEQEGDGNNNNNKNNNRAVSTMVGLKKLASIFSENNGWEKYVSELKISDRL